MKSKYPNYKKEGTNQIEKNLSHPDGKIFNSFLTFCGTNAGDKKVKERRSELLQLRDIFDKPFNKWNETDLEGFLYILKRDGRKPNTQMGILSTLQLFLKWNFKDFY